jgi:hypothetical protein
MLATEIFMSTISKGMHHCDDSRRMQSGKVIPSEGYCDQPYVVETDDGAWLCVMTTGTGHEGDPGQHPVTFRSYDQGQTWGEKACLEPSDGPEASYAVLLKVSSGRIYAFYNYNTDRVPEVKTEEGSGIPPFKRVDSLGDYVFKYSDDGGLNWSDKRYSIPVREFACDRNNVYGGKIRFFWNVGRPCVRTSGEVIIPLHKVGAMGAGFFAQSEGAFIASSNILTEADPAKIVFETLPDGEHGLKMPTGGGRIAEEHSLVELSDGSLYCVYRGVDGWPACSYSRDGGHSWEPPQYKTYTPGGRRMKNPRAANFVWRCSNGRYVYWFHNHGGEFIRRLGGHSSLPNGLSPVDGRSPYDDRNPAWLCAGQEVDGPNGKIIEWSQPEILLYDDDPYIRMSYPDLMEKGGKFWVTETQKETARAHAVDPSLIDGLFGQLDNVAPDNLPGLLCREYNPMGVSWLLRMPQLPLLSTRDLDCPYFGTKDLRAGCSIELLIDGIPTRGETLFDSRNGEGAGILVRSLDAAKIEVVLSDARTVSSWTSDAGCLVEGEPNHVGIIIDGGPKLILFVINGVLCDGGDERQFGWGRYNPNLRELKGAAAAEVGAFVTEVAIYGRALRVSEMVQNCRHGVAGSDIELLASSGSPTPARGRCSSSAPDFSVTASRSASLG